MIPRKNKDFQIFPSFYLANFLGGFVGNQGLSGQKFGIGVILPEIVYAAG
jgi:hypothetical protein